MTAEHLERTIETTSETDKHEASVVSLMGLRRVLKELPRGVTGPEAKGVRRISVDSLYAQLPDDIVNWTGSDAVVDSVSKTFSKLMARRNEPTDTDAALTDQLADSITDIIRIANFPESATGRKTVANLIQTGSVAYAQHYLSPEFIDELQQIAATQPKMQERVERFFTKSELFRRGSVSRNMAEDTRQSVECAVKIMNDRAGYVEQLLGEKPSDHFVEGLTEGVLLTLTTRQPNSVDAGIINAAKAFALLATEYPALTAGNPSYVVRQLIQSDPLPRMDSIRQTLDKSMQIYSDLIEDGVPEGQAVSIATHGTFGRPERTPVALARRKASGAMKPHRDKTGEVGSVQYRKLRAAERGVLQPRDAIALTQETIEYRDLLYDIDESPEITDTDERSLLDKIYETRENIHRFQTHFKDALGSLAGPFRRGFEERFTEVLYAMKYIIDHPETPVMIPMGSKSVEVSLDAQDIVRSLTFLEAATREMASIVPGEHHRDESYDGVEIGYIDGTRDNVMLLTKARRSPSVGPVERGKSSRINFIVGMGGIVPSAVASEREQACASLRIDQAEDGTIDIDIGGKTDNPYTPDFMIAKTISLGAWYRSQLKGSAEKDYHVSIDRMSEDEFAAIVMRMRDAIPISQTPLRVPSGRS